MIRSLSIRDIPLLNRYRNRGLFLDSIPTLTWGRAMIPAGALLSTFSSLAGVFTSLEEQADGHPPLLGQVVHSSGSPFAHFSFLAPRAALESPSMPELLEHLIKRVGARGAHSLIAEVDEESPAFVALRRAGFSIYARQRIWRITRTPGNAAPNRQWRLAGQADALAVNLLCSGLVPGLVQQVEPVPWDGLSGYVHHREGELMAFADVRRGPVGQWLQPFVHLDAEPFSKPFAALVAQMHPNRRRPVYVCLRSYQNWLEPDLEGLGAQPGLQQAVMVKRTARRIKNEAGQRLLAAETRRAEPTTPIQIPTPFVRRDLELTIYDQTPNYR